MILPTQVYSIVPIGGIIVWGSDKLPPNNKYGYWLECNGQAIDSSRYPELASIYGTNVPDYRGFFLRGVGGNSAKIGIEQGDAIRNITSTLGQQMWGSWNGPEKAGFKGQTNNVFYYNTGTHPNGMASFPRSYGGYVNDPYWSSSANDGWEQVLTKYRYTLVGDSENGYYLQEHAETANLRYYAQTNYLQMDLSLQVPTAVENRPINKSVIYLIRAK